MCFADWPGSYVLHRLSAAKLPGRVLRRYSKHRANGCRARYARHRAPQHAHGNPPHQGRWNPYADEWASDLDGFRAGEQGSSRSRHHFLSAAKEISDGHADLRTYLPRDREVHRHRVGAKRTRPDIRVPVPIFGGPAGWQKPGALWDDTGGPDCWGFRDFG